MKYFEAPYINELQKVNMVKQVIRLTEPFLYKRESNGIKVFCPDCQKYTTLSEEQFKQVKYARVCPSCYREINRFVDADRNTYNHEPKEYLICDDNNGVEVSVKFTFDKEPKLIKIKHVYHQEITSRGTLQKWVKDIRLYGMGYPLHIRSCEREWSKTRGTYDYYFWASYGIFKTMLPMSKKEYLEANAQFITKSNQKKLVMDYLFSPAQLKAIVMFDLKSANEVYKNRVWIRENIGETHDEIVERFNSYTLNYLSKNHISLRNYYDYENMCKILNRKLDKPKDFILWHDRLNLMIKIKENPELVAKAGKRYKKLSKHNYKKKEIEIKAFESYEEILDISHKLHNCMSRLYAEPYCKGKTDLFHLDVNGIPTLAIEVNKGKLTQCYGDHNKLPDAPLEKIVKKWARNYATS